MTVSVPNRFISQSLYDIFSVDKNASSQEIKKAYRRLALKLHPDHNHNSMTSTAEFSYITLGYQILCDNEKRELYDDTGSIDEAVDGSTSSESFDTAYDYYRSLFPKFTIDDITSYQLKYINSSDELDDILDAWNKYHKLELVIESVPFADSHQVQRYIDIINSHSDKQCKYTQKQINSLIKKLQRDERVEQHEFDDEQMKSGKKEDDDLFSMIQNKHKANSSKLNEYYDSLYDKYSALQAKSDRHTKQSESDDPLTDADFDRIQREMDAKRNKKENINENESSGSKRKRTSKR